MRLEKKHRHSIEKKNAPYRGVSGKEDFVNGTMEVIHDLVDIANISGEKGHRKIIQDRMDLLVSGEGGGLESRLYQTGRICRVEESNWSTDLTTWQRVNNTTVTKNGKTFIVSEGGLLDPAGIRLGIDVQPGDVYMLSMKIRPLTGKVDEIKWGASRINLGNKELETLNLTGKSTGVYVDKRLYCQHREQMEIALYLHDLPTTLAATSVEISDFHIYRVYEEEIRLKGLEMESKVELEEMSQEIKSLKQ